MIKHLLAILITLVLTASTFAQGKFIPDSTEAIGTSFGYSQSDLVKSISGGIIYSNGRFDLGAQLSRATIGSGDFVKNGTTFMGFSTEAYILKISPENENFTISAGATYLIPFTSAGKNSYGLSSTVDLRAPISRISALHFSLTGGFLKVENGESSGFYGFAIELHANNSDNANSVISVYASKDKLNWSGGLIISLFKITPKN